MTETSKPLPMMDLIICFIDDSEFEHDLVKNQIAPFAPRLTFVQAYTFDDAKRILGDRIPALFLLDLWGQDPAVKTPSVMSKGEVEARIGQFKSIDSVYEGLEKFEGDRNNEFLRRLFSIVDSWRSLFEEASNRVGQNRKYGLSNLKLVRESYPGIPAVFYTRKSLIYDAVAMLRAGADGLFIKPTGHSDEETRSLTRNYAPSLLQELELIVDRLLPWAINKPENLRLHESWQLFRSDQKK